MPSLPAGGFRTLEEDQAKIIDEILGMVYKKTHESEYTETLEAQHSTARHGTAQARHSNDKATIQQQT